MMNEQALEKDTIMEVKEDFMLSPAGDSEPTFRTAHFLKPIANSIHEPTLNDFNLNPSFSSSVLEPKECPFKINFNGWRYPYNWVMWVDQLKLKYESVWKKVGIFEAIMSTKSHIKKNQNLVYGVVDKWCCETNTFVFPFGEATITLEDVVVLGGYSLFGAPVFEPLEDREMEEVEKKLINARKELYNISSTPRTSIWIDLFIDKGSEIEHEAFLATWLSIFVFPHNDNVVKSCVFPIAIRLARGNPIALAPAVLASLYKDLSLFKQLIFEMKFFIDKSPSVLEVNIQSPFYLVQVWVWERFQNLQPQPKLINNGDPLLFRWHTVKALKIDNVRLAFDSAIDDFLWRPYVRYGDKFRMFYPNDEILVPVNGMDKQMLSFVMCLRVSELVGIDSIEQYLPHRVAMQFGMDQDVPGYVPRLNGTKSIAWKNYCRPFSEDNLYFPSRFFEADVTTCYAKWWKKSLLGCHGFVKNVVPRQKRSARSLKCSSHLVEIPLDFPPPKLIACGNVTSGESSYDGSKTGKGDNKVDNDDVSSAYIPKVLETTPYEYSVEDGLVAQKNIDANAPSSLGPKHTTMSPLISVVEDCNHVLKDDANESKEEAKMSSDKVCQFKTEDEIYSYLSEESVAELERRISQLERVRVELKMERLLH